MEKGEEQVSEQNARKGRILESFDPEQQRAAEQQCATGHLAEPSLPFLADLGDLVGLNEPFLDCLGDRTAPTLHLELVIDFADVFVGGVVADAQFSGGFFDGFALNEEL